MQSPTWSANTRLIVALSILAGSLALLIYAFKLVETLVIAALLAILVYPFAVFLEHKLHFKRGLAVALVYILVIAVIASLPALVGTLAFAQVRRLSQELQLAIEAINKWISQPIILFGFDLSPHNVIQNVGQSAGSALASLSGDTLLLLSEISHNFLWVLAFFVSLYYFLKEGSQIKPRLVRLVAPAYQADAERLLSELSQVWIVFMRVQTLIFVILTVLFLFGASVVVGLYRLGLIPFSTLGLIIMLGLVWVLVLQVDHLILRPQLLSSQLRLHTGVVLISLIGALAIGGILAAIVVVPLLASIKVVGSYVRAKMLGFPPWPDETQPN